MANEVGEVSETWTASLLQPPLESPGPFAWRATDRRGDCVLAVVRLRAANNSSGFAPGERWRPGLSSPDQRGQHVAAISAWPPTAGTSRTLWMTSRPRSWLFAMIAEDLAAATQALLGGGAEAVTALAERQQIIDALDVEIEQLAGREILLQAPVGWDLRFLLTVLRIVPELERPYDLVMDLAARAGRVRDTVLSAGSLELARRMADLATCLWRQAVDAWYSRDRTAAAAMAEHNTQMSELHASMTAEIASAQMPVRATMEMTLAARD